MNMVTSGKRITIGVIVSIAILLLLAEMPVPIADAYFTYRLFDYFYAWPGAGGFLAMFLAAFGGAYVAKVQFIVPAVILAVGEWILIVYIANSIGAAAGQANLIEVAFSNVLGLLFGVIGGAFGAHLGARLVEFHGRKENVGAS